MFKLKKAPRIEENVRIIRLLRAKQIKYGINIILLYSFKANLKLCRPITSIFSAGSVHAKTRLHKEIVHRPINRLLQATEI